VTLRPFLGFLSAILVLYAALAVYVGRPVFAGTRGLGLPGLLIRVAYVTGALAYPAGRLLGRILPGPAASTLLLLGGWFLALLIQGFLLNVAADLIRLLDRFFPLLPARVHLNPEEALRRGLLLGFLLCLVGTGAGALNARFPALRTLDLRVPKPAPAGREALRVVLASDIHAGIPRDGRTERLVEKIRPLSPDLILLPGDLVDEGPEEMAAEGTLRTLRRLRAPLGVYASLGNHEFYRDPEGIAEALEKGAGIRVLRDERVEPIPGLILAGRRDVSFERAGRARTPLAAILRGADPRAAILLMDHTPVDLEEAQRCGVDLQVSGHTHYGQIWPFHLLVRRIFENPYGLSRRGSTAIYVSSGFGTWGPPIRTTARPEVVLFLLRFDPPEAPGGTSSGR